MSFPEYLHWTKYWALLSELIIIAIAVSLPNFHVLVAALLQELVES
jgi:hypothetical protein